MVSPESPPATTKPAEQNSGPQISFSAEILDDLNFITISPHDKEKEKTKTSEFEFLSTTLATPTTMLSADELFFEGKMLPFGQKQCSNNLKKINLKSEEVQDVTKIREVKPEENNNRMNWFIDEDPSPRPPKCTVLWKELLRLKKHRASSLSTSSSTSSSSSASSIDEDANKKEKHVKKKKGLERTRSTGIKIRPMVNLPVCTQGVRSISMPPPYSSRKGMLDR
ncbi:hypothetical protein HanRHA438_Chr10g0451841 [Helianthus annuus]|uniref:Uncharacterized protein n=1 Tax=Helianthus annuus TaxID=4232 RepID=A0A251TKV8_HELAN|nr:uncharacterized protein LOC110885246 [Helianthus annuus]KAF5786341.1 hypothetical protein HanXRQr2_Chr10g0439731 [Helianthus annuus]KAJ0513775.1 hypothetical protein HanHA300_Chr10g0361691 [Helianthus annuus]KAJ0521688.1 hypothetical protein HanIR_Chr10g0473891 [Helianthus annuus]KAJ0529882.1 hypothetical protein HanHA89_Chr10g0383181 [Helianthus annuus]KAJ0696754.1 hypothetical protein HanLR1_Chr10g0360891 [Helianthus annuus]